MKFFFIPLLVILCYYLIIHILCKKTEANCQADVSVLELESSLSH